MDRYRSAEWKKLKHGRDARKQKASLLGEHPLSRIDKRQCHEWMREDCAQYDTARESREDSLVGVVIQVASAALLAIPGLIFGVSKEFPSFSEAPFVHLGLIGFFLSLLLAMSEQLLSAHAYGRRRTIAIQYYQKKSTKVSDPIFAKCTRICRYNAYGFFVLSLAISAAAIAFYEDTSNVRQKQDASPAAASPAAASPAAASPAAASPAAPN